MAHMNFIVIEILILLYLLNHYNTKYNTFTLSNSEHTISNWITKFIY